MDNKTRSIVSYITLIGWLIAYFSPNKEADGLLKYHLRQSLGLVITWFVGNMIIAIVVTIVPALGILYYCSFAFLALMIFGMINATNEVSKPLPLIGKLFEHKFAFIG